MNNAPFDQYAVETLLAELTFGDFDVPAATATRLTSRIFETVECHSWMPHRKRLLRHVIAGLRSKTVRAAVIDRLSRWFPERAEFRASIIEAMLDWPQIPEVVDTLTTALHSERADVQRAAAVTLAHIGKGDEDLGNRMAHMAFTAVDPLVRAAALECLRLGWPEHERLADILTSARKSLSPELRIAAINCLIDRREQEDADRDALLELRSWIFHLDHYWTETLVPTLLRGWPQDSKMKKIYLKAARNKDYRAFDQREEALAILVRGYPGDDEVANLFVEQLHGERVEHFLDDTKTWKYLPENFKDNPILVHAIDELFQGEQHIWAPVAALAASVGCTPTGKAKLISLLDAKYAHWPATMLLEKWGMADPDVREALTDMACGSIERTRTIAYLLPKIIEDKVQCRDRLLVLLRSFLSNQGERQDYFQLSWILQALEEIEDLSTDAEVLEIALQLISSVNEDEFDYADADRVGWVISRFSTDSRVRALAEQQLTIQYGNLSVIARIYGNDVEFQSKLLRLLRPLPAELRELLARHLNEGYAPVADALAILEEYDYDQDAAVKSQASIGYYSLLKESDTVTDEAIQMLGEHLLVTGWNMDERRLAAFCGLLILGRVDIAVNAWTAERKRIGSSLWFHHDFRGNIPAIELMLRHWQEISQAFGDKEPSWLFRGDFDFWNIAAPLLSDFPIPAQEALSDLENTAPQSIDASLLRFLGRERPKTNLLREYCLATIRKAGPSIIQRGTVLSEAAIVAAELLASNFRGDVEVLAQLLDISPKENPHEAVLIALLEGWADNDEVQSILTVQSDNKRKAHYVTVYAVHLNDTSARNVDDKILFQNFRRILSSIRRNPQTHNGLIARIFTRMIRNRDALHTLLMEHLSGSASPSEKATFPRVIAAARGISPELRQWCIAEVNKQLDGTKSPEIGFDLTAGEFRPVVHCLLDIVT